jgi:hypothetical protein
LGHCGVICMLCFGTMLVPEEEKYKLVREGIHHLTFLDGLIVNEIEGKALTKYGHLFGVDPKIVMPLQVWGESGVIKTEGKIRSKLQLRGKAAMFIGYAVNSTPIRTACVRFP